MYGICRNRSKTIPNLVDMQYHLVTQGSYGTTVQSLVTSNERMFNLVKRQQLELVCVHCVFNTINQYPSIINSVNFRVLNLAFLIRPNTPPEFEERDVYT